MKITVEMVRAAYEKTGRKPIRNRYQDGGVGSCVLDVLALAEGIIIDYSMVSCLEFQNAGLFAKLGISAKYACGLRDGWDGFTIEAAVSYKPQPPEFEEGWKNGVALREALNPSYKTAT